MHKLYINKGLSPTKNLQEPALTQRLRRAVLMSGYKKQFSPTSIVHNYTIITIYGAMNKYANFLHLHVSSTVFLKGNLSVFFRMY